MTEKTLVQKLNNLKNVKPEVEWLKSNRELFLTQISNAGTNKLGFWEVFYINIKNLTKVSAQPVFALGVFLFVLVASSVFGHKLFSEAKPNDSLYIARVISEKAKLTTVMDSNERNRMAVQFAANHAKDISAVLANPEFNTEENQDQVARLSESFNKEIETVKVRMEKMAARNPVSEEVSQPEDGVASSTAGIATSSDEEIVSIAAGNDLIEENGIQVSEAEPATTTPEVPAKPEIPKKSNPVEEVKELFERREYDTVINKLQEVSESVKK